MSTSIFFNGRLTHVPGSYTEVDASGLARVGLSASGIVAIVGEAEGGAPLSVLKATVPGRLSRLVRSGDLREAGAIAFDPSADDDIPGGAQQVWLVKTNPATQSSLTIDNADGDALTLTSVDYGLFTTQIRVTVASGTVQGKAITLAFEDTTESLDNVGGDIVFSLNYAPGSIGAETMVASVNPATGVKATFSRTDSGLDSDYDGEYPGIAGNLTEKLANVTVAAVVSVVSSSASDTTQSITLYGKRSTSGVLESETLALNGTTPVVGTKTWQTIYGFFLTAVAVGNVTLRDNPGPTAMYTITAGQTSVGGGLELFASAIECGGSIVKVKAGDAGATALVVIGTDTSGTAQMEELTLNGTTYVSGSATWGTVVALGLGYVSSSRSLTLQGLLLNEGDTLTVVSSSASDTTQTVTIYGISGSDAVQSEVVTLTGTTPATTSGTWKRVYGVALSAVSVGTITVASVSPVINLYVWNGASSRYAGLVPLDRVAVDGGAVTLIADGTTTRKCMVVGLDATGAAQLKEVTLTSAVAVAVAGTWREITGLALGHVQAARAITLGGDAFDLAVGTYDTVQKVYDHVASLEGWTCTVVTTSPRTDLIAEMDKKITQNVLSTTVSWYADLQAVVDAINASSQLVTAAAASGATGAPSNISATYLTGGVEGTTLFAHWQAALDLLQDEDVSTIVLLTDDASVHAAAITHAIYMAGAGRMERDLVLGSPSGATFTEAVADVVQLNSRHARYCIQDSDRYNTDGELETFPPYFTAAIAAGMQAGAPAIGTSLTFKYANVVDVTGDDSYSVREDGDALIQAGILVLEKVPGRGFRWLRNVTTHLADSNIAYVEASTNQATNYAVRNFRDQMESAVGARGFAGTVNAAVSVAVGILGRLIDSGAITTWRNLTITLDADVMTVDVEIAPVTPVNFVKSTLHLVTTTLAAAA